MLQYPINVYPDKVTFDSQSQDADTGIHFVFKGDILNAVYIKVYDYETQELVINTVVAEPDLSPLAYNNDQVDINGILSSLNNNHYSYVLQMMFCQVYKRSSTYYGNFDRFVSRGEITADYTANSTTLQIEDGINVIYEWNKVGDICSANYIDVPVRLVSDEVMVAGIVIEADGKRASIRSYNKATGEVTLDVPFHVNLAKGTSYVLYSSYLITEQYFFKTIISPILEDAQLTTTADGLNYSAFYWQANRNMLKYYTLDLYKYCGNDWYYPIKQTDKIYSQNIDYTFAEDYDYAGLGGNDTTRGYKLVFTGVLQNGMVMTDEITYTAPQRSATQIASAVVPQWNLKTENALTVFVITADGATTTNKAYRAYRLNADGLYNPDTSPNKLLIDYQQSPDKQLVYDGEWNGSFTDYTVSAQGSYRYMIVPYDRTANSTTIYAAVISDVITTEMDGYTITAIYDTNLNADNLMFYKYGDTWKFYADIQDTTMTQNMSKELHVGYGKYSTLTSTDVDYQSGTLSGMLGYMNCANKQFVDDIELVRAWRRFIAQDCQFILRSPKGDVWVVNVLDVPTTEYQENTTKYPTRFTFSWAECGNIKDILVGENAPPKATTRR